MKNPIEKSKFTIGLILLIQSLSFLVVSIAQCKKRKSLAGAFLALSAIEGILGAILVAKSASKEDDRLTVLDSLCDDYMDFEGMNEEIDVPVNEEIDEEEFHF